MKTLSLSLAVATLVAAALSPVGAAAADAPDEATMKLGKRVFLMCRSCHSTEPDGRHKVGPNLHGMFGSKAGVKEGFKYSDVVKNSGITWSEETLNEWLVKPKNFLPGNKMAFAGVPKEEERKALIAFLKAETGAK
ncbi:MAG: cytochrome c family protein [Rhodospirillaceae bacterium]|nr:cytochrome c family protein [Rhodospirillaceae bacterium]